MWPLSSRGCTLGCVWFEALTGFCESDVDDVAAQFNVEGDQITSMTNGRTMRCGAFKAVSLAQLREQLARSSAPSGTLEVREVVANVQQLHVDPANAGALFQVASQFNTLEMVSPTITPEDGIDRYEADRTQGPASAIACGAGTIYRNYLVPLPGQVGQSATNQINCLADLSEELGAKIKMRNGYALPETKHLDRIGRTLASTDEPGRDRLMGFLRIGLQSNTEVTLNEAGHFVTQAYCSALPIAYRSLPASSWEPFARLVLDAAYEATIIAALINAEETGNRRAYLTLLGGGAFGNPVSWILAAIERSIALFAHHDLQIGVVSYGVSNPKVHILLN